MKNLNSLFFFDSYFKKGNAPLPKKWVIADIHGCYFTLKNLIEEKIQPAKNDMLFFLGDYIDRGSHSKQVIDYIRQLQQDGYGVVALRGNHEDVMIRCYQQAKETPQKIGFAYLEENWLEYGGEQTLQSFGVEQVSQIPEEYIHYLDSLPYYYTTQDYVLVHAGLNFLDKNPFSDKLAMIWAKNYPVYPEKIQHRTLLHGHVPFALSAIEKKIEKGSPLIPLDNGCIYSDKSEKGNLIAFELESRTLVIQPNIEEKSKKIQQHARLRNTTTA